MSLSNLAINPVYLFYGLAAVAAMLLFEAVYVLCFSGASYRKNINRRLNLLKKEGNREGILLQLRRERGLTGAGAYRLPAIAFNTLILQSGLTIGITRLAVFVVCGACGGFVITLIERQSFTEALAAFFFCLLVAPYFTLRIMRSRRQKKFGAQFPDALDIIVRSLRAGHPVPIAINMVAREMADPVGTEFGIVADEITYGADLETAMRNLSCRIGQEDLPLFVTAVAIQASTGGNLGEILSNLSSVIRQRFKMRRKVRALAAEGRASALILSSLPIGMFFVVQMASPDFYASVWKYDLTKIGLGLAGGWMAIGNLVMYRLVNFRI
ncbi:MAG TPA: type II secretion system F family protein [Xanthobacteraceae bacterium]|jgi:tight adherence protein B|nr:type II secretion system F family protein [Xanthobacteraceae bacterium]